VDRGYFCCPCCLTFFLHDSTIIDEEDPRLGDAAVRRMRYTVAIVRLEDPLVRWAALALAAGDEGPARALPPPVRFFLEDKLSPLARVCRGLISAVDLVKDVAALNGPGALACLFRARARADRARRGSAFDPN